MKLPASFLFVLFSAALCLAPPAATADSLFTPPGLYNVEQLKLANGFRIILKQRRQAHNVSIRLVVHLGTRHFDCDRLETPHVLEHLLFSGTSKHTENELDRLIEEHGGLWNAVTGQEYTTYDIDIFDRYADLALGALYEIMTDTTFSGGKLERAKDIVARELGGTPSALRQFLYLHDVGKTAWQKADEWLLPGDSAACGNLPNVKKITEGTVTGAFRAFYTPRNMTLIIVGNFDRDAVLSRIRGTFGMIETSSGKVVPPVAPVPYPAGGPVEVKSRFAPFLGSSGHVGAAFRTIGADSPDAPALQVLNAYLDRLLYERIRVENGLSYNPEVSSYLRPDYGILYVSADTGLRKIDHVQELISGILERVVQAPPSAEEVERTKQKLLLQWVQGYETNRGLADFYVRGVHDLDRLGKFRNYEQDIERVSADDIVRVVKETLRNDRKVRIYGLPTLSYTCFYIIIGVTVFVVFLRMFIVLSRAMTRGRRVPWYRR